MKIYKYLKYLEIFFFGLDQVGIINTLKLFFSRFVFKKKSFHLKLKNNLFKNFYIRNAEDSIVFIEHIFTDYYGFEFISNKDNFVFIDCGAFNGIETFRNYNLFHKNKKKCKFFSIEANNLNFNTLKKNINNINEILIFNNALFHTDNKELYENKDNDKQQGFYYSTEKNINSVNSISINSIIKTYNIDTIDIIKIDIEGLELEILKTNNQWLKITNCIILEYYHLKNLDDLLLLIKNFSEKGFTYDFHKENIVIYKKNLDLNFKIIRGIK